MSSNVYLAVFRTGLTLKGTRPPEAAQFHRERESSSFPYDAGDDPSLYWAMTYPRERVTWGVCRPNVRRAARRGDVIVFISFHFPVHEKAGQYRLVAAQRVQFKLTHTAIFRFDANACFRGYPNLLVRPREGGWEQHEPALPVEEWHDDWLARISNLNGIPVVDFKAAGTTHRPGSALTIHGSPIEEASNYVVFTPEPEGFIVPNPPLIATWREGELTETWSSDPRSREIRELTLGLLAPGRSLRVNNQIPHPHIVGALADDVTEWLSRLRNACSQPAA